MTKLSLVWASSFALASVSAALHSHHEHLDHSVQLIHNSIPEIILEPASKDADRDNDSNDTRKRHNHHKHVVERDEHQHKRDLLEKRATTCAFPQTEGLVPITPNSQNGGWALSPNQECSLGSWCPFACPPGQLSYQWDPSVTSYTYPGSQYGGLFCDSNGNLNTPFPNEPYCKDGVGTVQVNNLCSDSIAVCQTVLPGNEAMLIPTNVDGGSSQVIAVPDPSYWASTAAHYYVNPPGVSTGDGCVWGSTANPWGNWAFYVAGANMDSNGNTFAKIGWNPVILQSDSPYQNTVPSYGIRITCEEGANCNGLPCEINPSLGINQVTSPDGSNGAGDGAFCVVTVPNRGTATIEVFEVGGSNSDNTGGSTSSDSGSQPSQESSSESQPSISSTLYSSPSPSPSTSSVVNSISIASPISVSSSLSTATNGPVANFNALSAYLSQGSQGASTYEVESVSDLFSDPRTALYNIGGPISNTTTASSSISTSAVSSTNSSSATVQSSSLVNFTRAGVSSSSTNSHNGGSSLKSSSVLLTLALSLMVAGILC
jgi:hypothetical protein